MDDLYSIDWVINVGSKLFEYAEDEATKYIDIEALKTIGNVGNEVGNIVMDSINSLKLLIKIKDIPTKLFMAKYVRYLNGVLQIPIEKRKKLINKLGEKKINREHVFMLSEINKTEEMRKIDYFVRLQEAQCYDFISYDDLFRYVMKVNRTLLCDLEYMRKNINNDLFPIKNISEEGLVIAGWILFMGIELDDFNNVDIENGDVGDNDYDKFNLYKYTRSAKDFCKLMEKDVVTAEIINE